MRRRTYIAGVTASLALALAGCPNAGTDATPFCTICGDSGGTDSGGPLGADAAETDAGPGPVTDTGVPAGAPTVTFLSPPADATVYAPSFEVVVTIDDPDGVDPDSVRCLANEAAMPVSGAGSDWTCSVSTAGLETGPVTVVIRANDVTGAYGEGSRDFDFDGGPVITFISPDPAPIETLSGTILIQFVIEDPADVLPGSVFADVNGLLVANLTEGPAGTWTGSLVTDDPNAPVADGMSLVSAYATSLNGVEGSAQVDVILDNSGPAITFVNPLAGQLVSGLVPIVVDIDDPGGVVGGLVTARVGLAAPFSLTGPASGGGTFTGTIDTNSLPPALASTFIEVEAVDALGNWNGTSVLIEIDNTIPRMELDPLDLVLCDLSDAVTAPQCTGLGGEQSLPFDPVGADALDDLDVVGAVGGTDHGQWFPVRAEIRDFGQGPYTNAEAGIAGATVYLYVLDDASVPLVVDADGDLYCDIVNPTVIPGGAGPVFALTVVLDPIPPTGGPPYLADGLPPEPIILLSPMTVAVEDPPTPSRAAIYSVAPVVSDGIDNLGQHFDSLNLTDGPACLAVTAEDAIGNVGVSPPIRICVANGSAGACSGWVPPGCTGTMVGSTVTSAPCMPRPFAERVFPTGF